MSHRIARAIMAADGEHWITTENGSHLLIGGEGGDYKVIGGAGGKMNGQFIGPSSMSKNVEKAKESTTSAGIPSTTPSPVSNLPSHTIYNGKKVEITGEGKSKKGNPTLKIKKEDGTEIFVPRIDTALGNEEEQKKQRELSGIGSKKEEAAKTTESPAPTPSSSEPPPPSFSFPPPEPPSGHQRLSKPLKIQRETEKAYGVSNPDYEEAQEEYNWGGNEAVAKHTSAAAREAWQERKSLNFLPKSHSTSHEGHVVSVADWLARKNNMSTVEREENRTAAFEAGKNRYEALIDQAKAAGVPGIRARMKTSTIKEKMRAHGMAVDSYMALDYKSVRDFDEDGRLHVEETNISKANICDYLGSEIPDYQSFGLQPDKIYKLWRDPAEIRKAAETFNNLPVLNQHIPVTADDHRPENVVGSTGTDAHFDDPYLKISMVIWAAHAIAGIESGDQKEISSAYRYVPDMTPGTFNGQKYDGVMRQIRGSHVALVEDGRAGPDVVVADSALPKKDYYPMSQRLSRKAALARGALTAYLRPKLAQDAAIDFSRLLRGVTAKNWRARKPIITEGVIRLTGGKLAQDANLNDLVNMLDCLDGEGKMPDKDMGVDDDMPDDTDMVEDDAETVGKIMSWLKDKLTPQQMAELHKMVKPDSTESAEDDPPPFAGEPKPGEKKTATDAGEEEEKRRREEEDRIRRDKEYREKKDGGTVTKAAMDAALKRTAADVERATMARINGMIEAQKAVRPLVGEITVAMDSAEDVYRFALETAGRDVTGIHPSAFPAIVELLTEQKSAVRPSPRLATDSAGINAFKKSIGDTRTIRNLG